MKIISTLSNDHIETYINNRKNCRITYAIPRNCSTFHQFIPTKYINTKRDGRRLFSPFLFQCFYFGYTSQIDKRLSKPNKKYNDVEVILELITNRDVYIIDIFQANQYLNKITKTGKSIQDEDMIEYYKLMAETFKSISECSKEELSSYQSPVYLLQREIQFEEELVKIKDEQYQQQITNIMSKRHEMILERNTSKNIKRDFQCEWIKKFKNKCSIL